MSIELPEMIAAYFEADRGQDVDAVASCFAHGAVVRDEGHVYTGRDAIRQWKAGSNVKYTYTAEPIAIANEGNATVVTSHLVGNFPGSPIDLRYFFVLTDEGIASLEIKL